MKFYYIYGVESKMTQPDQEEVLRKLIFEKVVQFKEKGYAYFDLIDMGFFTKQEILRMQNICMNYYYKYFYGSRISCL